MSDDTDLETLGLTAQKSKTGDGKKAGASLVLPNPKAGPVSVQVQSILFDMDEDSVARAMLSLERAISIAIYDKHCSRVTLSYGDTSATRCLDEAAITRIKSQFGNVFDFEYEFFGKNLGSARGHNELAGKATTDYLLILNPDVIVSPRLLETMLKPFTDGSTGMVEGKQLPIEHPKDYDPKTGETGWATTAVALTPLRLFQEIDGFDADSFFLYCDDVDYSWRVREAGYKIIFVPNGVVFHDKRISAAGQWQPSNAERRYSAEAALMMAHKWSRPDLVAEIANFYRGGNEFERAALAKYEKKKSEGILPEPRDPDHRVGEFINYMYAKHRYNL